MRCDYQLTLLHFDVNLRAAGNAYRLTFDRIQKDVQSYGPIAASIRVYDDFVNYKSGRLQNALRTNRNRIEQLFIIIICIVFCAFAQAFTRRRKTRRIWADTTLN